VTTYVVRHAPTVSSAAYRVNGDPSVDVPVTSDGEAACVQARPVLPIDEIAACVASPFRRCQRTADLLVNSTASIFRLSARPVAVSHRASASSGC
jgi:broad specificity phosphatase PhoE